MNDSRIMMTVEEYLVFDRASEDERYEYIDGIVTLRVRGTINSSRICVNIIGELSIALRGKPCQVFGSDLRVGISATRYVYPDVFVTCEQSDFEGNNDIVSFPRVIFEVLSLNAPVTASSRQQKFIYYRACPSIQEYVFVNRDEVAVDVYRRINEKLWTVHLFGPGDDVELKSINVTVPIATIYENARF
ncbi:MAG: Uma2 family endonuclease [Ktedonobacteraceae bacterium]